MENFKNKVKKLQELMAEYTKNDLAIAFSGGVDSTLLLKLACEAALKNNTKVYAYTIHTMLHPMEELEITEKLAGEYGAIYRAIQVDELKESGIENNPVNRCYLCKKYMFTSLQKDTIQNHIPILIEGTNLDDTKAYRPGIQALKELDIKSPLLMAEFTKSDIRELALELGIEVANKPSAPCLATRFPYNTMLCQDELDKVEAMEGKLKEMGFYNLRCRIHGKLVRIEVDEQDIIKLVKLKEEVISYVKQTGYDYITVDLEGFRSGSQDLHIQ